MWSVCFFFLNIPAPPEVSPFLLAGSVRGGKRKAVPGSRGGGGGPGGQSGFFLGGPLKPPDLPAKRGGLNPGVR